MLIQGSCHCGNVSFELDWGEEVNEIPARTCDCSFCVKHGGTWTSNPAGKLEISVKDGAQLSRYEFGTKTAVFHVCGRCGVPPVVTSEVEGNIYAVVNVNTFDNIERSRLQSAPISFDGEGTGDRLARRQRNWIANVSFR